MQKSVTTGVRLPRELMVKVERKAALAGCARNTVIITALELYLRDDEQAAYVAEARRQSELATKFDPQDTSWDDMVERDFRGPSPGFEERCKRGRPSKWAHGSGTIAWMQDQFKQQLGMTLSK